MSMDWDQYKSTGDFVSFKEVGDSIVGTVIAVRSGTDFNGNPCPELIIEDDDGTEHTLTAGQVMLKRALAADEGRPDEGDRIAITYSGQGEAQPGKAPAKLFDVAVKRAGEPQAAPAAPSGVAAESLL